MAPGVKAAMSAILLVLFSKFKKERKEQSIKMIVLAESGSLFWKFSRNPNNNFHFHATGLFYVSWPFLSAREAGKYRCFFFFFLEHMDTANKIGIPLMGYKGRRDLE